MIGLLLATILGAPPAYDTTPFVLGGNLHKIVPADLNGDSRLDLVIVHARHFRVHLQTADGFDFTSALDVPAPPGSSVGWDVVDLDGDGPREIVLLLDGNEAKAWSLNTDGTGFDVSSTQGDLRGIVPSGFYHLSFARDVDADGDADLVIPRNDSFEIHIRGAGGTYSRGPSVVAQRNIRQTLETEGDLSARIGQSLHIPLFAIRDVNGDGRVDLSSRTDDRLDVYLAGANGVLPRAPTYSFDVAAERQKLGPIHGEDFDTSNILAPATRMVQVVTPDVNGDGAEDLLVRAGGRVDLYRASRQGVDTSHLTQRLKASGNVVGIATEDEDEDGLLDLWIFRIETVSLASAMWWLVVPGSLDVDVLIYRFDDEKGKFATRPTRRIELTVKFPALLDFMNELENISIEVKKRSEVPAAAADLTGRGARRDVVLLENASLRCYLDQVAPQPAGLPRNSGMLTPILKLAEYSRDKNEYTLELDKVADLIPSPGADLADSVAGLTPDLELPIAETGARPGLFLLDLNADGRDDVILIDVADEEQTKGYVFLSRT